MPVRGSFVEGVSVQPGLASAWGGRLAFIVLAWMLWAQQRRARPGSGFVTDPVGFIVPTANQFIAPSTLVAVAQHFRGNPSEWDAYLGLPLCGVVVWVVWTEWSAQLVRVLACTAVIITILSLGPYVVIRGHQFPIPLPWLVTEHIPVLKNLLPQPVHGGGVPPGWCLDRLHHSPLAPDPSGATACRHRCAGRRAVLHARLIPSQARDVLAGGGVVLPSPFATSEDPVAMLVQAESNFAFHDSRRIRVRTQPTARCAGVSPCAPRCRGFH